MQNEEPKISNRVIVILSFLLWVLLFGIAYAQSPLFTSNQNQYFLFGLAKTGFGYLSNDWLLSTTDIAPLFSLLVFASKSIFHNNAVFYLEYFLIFGIYLYSLLTICQVTFPKLIERKQRTIFAFLIVFLHSAALRFLLANMINPDWEFLLEGGVAGQRLLGDVYQPSTFGVFLLLAIALFLKEKYAWAMASLSFAAVMHPTYLLSAATLTATFMVIRWQETKSIKQPLLLGLLAFALVSPIVVYVAVNFLGVDPAINAAGQQIVIEYRQPHHMIISNWLDLRVLVKFLLFVAALWVIRNHRLFWVLFIPGVLVITLTILQAVIQSPSLAMLFPWRLSVILVPLSTALLAAYFILKLIGRWPCSENGTRWTQALVVAAVVMLAIIGMVKFDRAAREKYSNPEYKLYSEVKTNLTADQVFMIPLKLQNFRLETGAPIVVEYKAAPQSSEGVLEWYERLQEVNHFYSGLPWNEACKRLPDIIQRYGVTHIVIPLDELKNQSCLEMIYQTKKFGVFIPIQY